MASRIVNFQMQQPGEMANPQTVGTQQQKRQSLADRLRRYGVDQNSGNESFSSEFDQQVRNSMRMREPQTPQQQRAGQIMKSYNAPGGGSKFGYELSSPMTAQRGMMGSVARLGSQLQSGASSLGRGAASLGSSAMKAMSAF
jgi:hypothetical protein